MFFADSNTNDIAEQNAIKPRYKQNSRKLRGLKYRGRNSIGYPLLNNTPINIINKDIVEKKTITDLINDPRQNEHQERSNVLGTTYSSRYRPNTHLKKDTQLNNILEEKVNENLLDFNKEAAHSFSSEINENTNDLTQLSEETNIDFSHIIKKFRTHP